MNTETQNVEETQVEYEAPQIEEVLTSETLEREVAYAGIMAISGPA